MYTWRAITVMTVILSGDTGPEESRLCGGDMFARYRSRVHARAEKQVARDSDTAENCHLYRGCMGRRRRSQWLLRLWLRRLFTRRRTLTMVTYGAAAAKRSRHTCVHIIRGWIPLVCVGAHQCLSFMFSLHCFRLFILFPSVFHCLPLAIHLPTPGRKTLKAKSPSVSLDFCIQIVWFSRPLWPCYYCMSLTLFCIRPSISWVSFLAPLLYLNLLVKLNSLLFSSS